VVEPRGLDGDVLGVQNPSPNICIHCSGERSRKT
jgi:hypothetical protein